MSTAQRLSPIDVGVDETTRIDQARCLYCGGEFTKGDEPVKLAAVLVAHNDCATNPTGRRMMQR